MVGYGIFVIVVGLFSIWPSARSWKRTAGGRRRAITLWAASGVVLVVSGVVVAITPVHTAEVFFFCGVGLCFVLVLLGTLAASRAVRKIS